MSYPPETYTAADPEASAWVRRSDAQPDLVYEASGNRVTYLASGAGG